MEKPILVEVIAYAPTAFYHCTHCEVVWQELGSSKGVHEEQLASSLPEDLRAQYQHLSDWINGLVDRYSDQVAIKVIDAASAEGFVKSLRYGTRRYPAFVIDHQKVGNSFEETEEVLGKKINQTVHASQK
jgi:hypothetical protein